MNEGAGASLLPKDEGCWCAPAWNAILECSVQIPARLQEPLGRKGQQLGDGQATWTWGEPP